MIYIFLLACLLSSALTRASNSSAKNLNLGTLTLFYNYYIFHNRKMFIQVAWACPHVPPISERVCVWVNRRFIISRACIYIYLYIYSNSAYQQVRLKTITRQRQRKRRRPRRSLPLQPCAGKFVQIFYIKKKRITAGSLSSESPKPRQESMP